MAEQTEYAEISDLAQTVRPYAGQDCEIVYTVYADRTLAELASIAGWTVKWVLFADPTDAAAVLVKSTASGITLDSALATATVTLSDDETGALTVGTEYGMQLWRVEAGNEYPLTGIGTLIPLQKPPLV